MIKIRIKHKNYTELMFISIKLYAMRGVVINYPSSVLFLFLLAFFCGMLICEDSDYCGIILTLSINHVSLHLTHY